MIIEFKHPKIIDALIDPKYKYIFTNTGTKLECWSLLNKKKIRYHYHDPYFPSLRIGRINKSRQNSLKLNKRNLKKFDATIIFTDHEKINYKIVNKYSKFIFDTRGVMRKKNFINNKIIEL
jgi:UDP-N-acetyl-D-glucosamine dehydrogenase